MPSSTNLTEAARAVHLFKINGYSATKAMGNWEYVSSKKLTVGGYDWEIHYTPSSDFNWTYWVALKLVFLGEARANDVKAAFSCLLVQRSGNVLGLSLSEEKSVSHAFKRPKDCSCDVLLKTRDDLEASGYIENDSFTVQCKITVLRDRQQETIKDRANAVVPSSDLHQHFGGLLQSKKGTDIIFVVSGKPFGAHRCILAARSPVFMAEFFGDMKEKCSHFVEIKDMEASVFRALLHFIYTDTLLELDEQQQEMIVMVQCLLAGADRYGLERLKLICQDKLSDCIGVDNVATTLVLAEKHNCLQLKNKCVEFIVDTPAVLDAVVLTEGYQHLMANYPLLLKDIVNAALARKK